MKILIVEDKDDEAQRLVDAITPHADVLFQRARSRTAAENLLEGANDFDLIICDLRIPHHDGGIDRDAQHGLAVHAAVSRCSRGTPTFFLTGVAAENVDDLTEAASGGAVVEDLGDGKPLKMVRSFRKDRILACAQEIIDLAGRLSAIDATQIEGPSDFVEGLSPVERRAIALAARQWNGVRAEVRPMGGGLAGGRTLHALVHDGENDRASVFLKIDRHERCAEELDRYNEFVVGTLGPGSFPQFVKNVAHCLGDSSCLVYKFADDWGGSLFRYLELDGEGAAAVVSVRALMARWESIQETTVSSLGQLATPSIGLDDLRQVLSEHYGASEELFGLIDALETAPLTLKTFAQHGDLHGENVLHSGADRPALIDCGDTGMHLAGHDPVTLELSLICHPSSPLAGGTWPTIDQALAWSDLDTYTEGCEHGEFVRACREWALDVAGEDGVRHALIAYVARQFKYADTPKPLLAAFLHGALSA